MPSNHYLHAHLDHHINTTQASAYWKASDGKYLGVNNKFEEVSGIPFSNIIGGTDMDLIWEKQAPIMMQNDYHVRVSESVTTFIEPSISLDKNPIHYLSHKTPLHNQKGKVIGIFGLSYRLEEAGWNEDRLNEMTLFIGSKPIDEIKKFFVSYQQKKYNLSQRQTECLYLLIKRMTMKEMAARLNLSPRTIEHYIEAIKLKLNCSSREEIRVKVYQMNESLSR